MKNILLKILSLLFYTSAFVLIIIEQPGTLLYGLAWFNFIGYGYLLITK